MNNPTVDLLLKRAKAYEKRAEHADGCAFSQDKARASRLRRKALEMMRDNQNYKEKVE